MLHVHRRRRSRRRLASTPSRNAHCGHVASSNPSSCETGYRSATDKGAFCERQHPLPDNTVFKSTTVRCHMALLAELSSGPSGTPGVEGVFFLLRSGGSPRGFSESGPPIGSEEEDKYKIIYEHVGFSGNEEAVGSQIEQK